MAAEAAYINIYNLCTIYINTFQYITHHRVVAALLRETASLSADENNIGASSTPVHISRKHHSSYMQGFHYAHERKADIGIRRPGLDAEQISTAISVRRRFSEWEHSRPRVCRLPTASSVRSGVLNPCAPKYPRGPRTSSAGTTKSPSH